MLAGWLAGGGIVAIRGLARCGPKVAQDLCPYGKWPVFICPIQLLSSINQSWIEAPFSTYFGETFGILLTKFPLFNSGVWSRIKIKTIKVWRFPPNFANLEIQVSKTLPPHLRWQLMLHGGGATGRSTGWLRWLYDSTPGPHCRGRTLQGKYLNGRASRGQTGATNSIRIF